MSNGILTALLAPVEYKPDPFVPDFREIIIFLCVGLVVATVIFLAGRHIVRYGLAYQDKNRTSFPVIYWLYPSIIGIAAFFIIHPFINVESIHNMEDLYIGYPRGTGLLVLLFHDMIYNHLPFFRLAVSLLSLYSDDIIAIRTMSLIVHCATVVPFYNLARSLYGRRAAWLSAILFTLAPLTLYYSKVALPYSWLRFFSTLFIWLFFVRLRDSRASHWPLIAAGVLGCYVHQFFFLIVAGSFVTLVITSDSREERVRRIRNFASVYGYMMIFASPLAVMQILLISTNMTLLASGVTTLIGLVPYAVNPSLAALRDAVAFPGMFFVLSSARSSFIAGIVVIVIAAVAFSFRSNRKSPLFIMTACVTALYLVLTLFYHNVVFSGGMKGWIPMWRHGLEIAPLLFLLAAGLMKQAFSSGKGKFVYVLFGMIFLVQSASAARILKGPNVPDARGAAKHVMSHVRDGDAVISLPSPIVLSSTFDYYFFPRETDVGEYPRWIALKENTSILADCSDEFVTYKSLSQVLFIRRIWKLEFDSRYFGIFPEFAKNRIGNFDTAFNNWRVVGEKRLPFVTLRLMEAPPPAFPTGDTLIIEAGVNDLRFVRGTKESVFISSESRTITGDGELVIPTAVDRNIEKVELLYGNSVKKTVDISPRNSRVYASFEKGGLYLISLKTAEGIEYDTIKVSFVPAKQTLRQYPRTGTLPIALPANIP